MLAFGAIRDSLASEKAPYVVTLFVAALAWTVLHTADRLSSVPFIEYQLTQNAPSNGPATLDLRIRNVGTKYSFDCFAISLAPRGTSSLRLGKKESLRVRLKGTVLVRPSVLSATSDDWDFVVTNVAPGADATLTIEATGKGEAAVLASVCPGDLQSSVQGEDAAKEAKAKSAVPILLERSATTFLAEYEIEVLWGGLLLWLLTMLVVGRKTRKKPSQSVYRGEPQEGRHDEEGSID